MPYVYDKRDTAEKYTAKENDTLQTIADKYAHIKDWKILALFNWGTDVPREVNRALAETIGCGKVDPSDPGKTALKPHADLSAEVLIPKQWKKDNLALDKQHKIKLKPLQPATAVSIKTLDKWFIPGAETCDVAYELEGVADCADKVAVEVYGSNYCKCDDWNKGRGKYSALPDTPVFRQIDGNASDARAEHALEVPGPDGKKKGWMGASNATDGILSVKAGADPRYINVAFSPYTLHLRYFKDDADKNARLVLQPFWPRFDEDKKEPAVTTAVEPTQIKVKWTNDADIDRGVLEINDRNGQRVHLATFFPALLTKGAKELVWNKQYRPDAENSKFGREYIDDSGDATPKNAPYAYKVTTFTRKPVSDSLKVKWEIKDIDKLERGRLLIVDGAGRVVFSAPVAKSKLAKGQVQEFAWDGKYSPELKNSKGGTDVIAADMPYRVQLQVHTGAHVAKGLALAAMHTEVRMYVHPATHQPSDLAYDAWFAQQSMALGLAPLVPGDVPAKGDGTKWYQHQLAQCGFHPGPVNGTAHDDYKLALKEFKRSVPKQKTGANYARLTIDDAENADTEAAIEHIEDRYKRKWFGSLTRVFGNDNNPDLSDAEIDTLLPNPGQDVVVWADDRQYYTQGDPANDEAGNNMLVPPFNLDNHRGAMDIGDQRTEKDAASIARPWLPLQVTPTLLSKTKRLSDAVAIGADKPEVLAAMRRALGPLRVDWTFDELPRDVTPIDTTMANYNKDYVRARTYVDWALANKQGTHTRKDTGRNAIYRNCPGGPDPANAANAANLGGIRPDTLADYYKQAFGYDDNSLGPWRAAAVTDTESVATVVHDHLAAGQTDKTDLFTALIGAAGAYFRPSRVAGDGYRVRAAVQFKKFTDYDFPNLDTLAARYPTAPQAHSARLRVWRKSSLRGYMCWGAATGNWGNTFINTFRAHYRTAHVYFVHEGGAAAQAFNLNAIMTQNLLKKIITKNVTEATIQNEAKVTLIPNDVWPWSGETDFGWPPGIRVAAGLTWDNCNNTVLNGTWRKFRAALILVLLREVEKLGVMRGHLLVEFDHNLPCTFQMYECNKPGTPHRYVFLERGAPPGNRMNNQPCPAAGCGAAGRTLAPLAGAGTSNSMPNGLGLPAVGVPLGATWLFWRGENVDRLKVVWVHEVGHHRHLEHAANAPGAAANLHDSENNTRVANWAPIQGGGDAAATRWDRRCIMSYSDAWYGELGCLCGRCVLRNRGWKVTGLGFPGPAVSEP